MTSFIKGVFRFFFGCAMLFFTAFCWQIVFNNLVSPALGLAAASYVAVFAVVFVVQNATIPSIIAIIACFNTDMIRKNWSTGEWICLSLAMGFFHMLVALMAIAYSYLFF